MMSKEDIKQAQRELGQVRREKAEAVKVYEQREIALYKKISQYNPRTNFPSMEFLELVHIKVIEGSEINDAIEDTLTELSKTDEWYADIKYLNVNYSKQIVEKYKNTKGYKELVSSGGLSTRELKKSKHTASHFRQLGIARAICNRFDNLERRVGVLENQIIEVGVEAAKARLENVDPDTLTTDERKSLSRFLKTQGYSTANISQQLKVSERTVRRYLSDA